MNTLKSRHVDVNDPIIKEFSWDGLGFEFYNRGWWSRIYEYQWMLDVCKEFFPDIQNKTAIDIATGIQHPGMFLLKSVGFKEVVGIDLFDEDKFMYKEHLRNGIRYLKRNIEDASHNEKYDCVACISFLEHIPENKQEAIMEKILGYVSNNGCAIFTFDDPSYDYKTNLPLYKKVMTRMGFVYEEDSATIEKVTTVNSAIAASELKKMNLSCYRLFARRKS